MTKSLHTVPRQDLVDWLEAIEDAIAETSEEPIAELVTPRLDEKLEAARDALRQELGLPPYDQTTNDD